MATLMEDPVVLPSGNTVDRTTIASYLLGDACDPFTRQPMALADVVPSKFNTVSLCPRTVSVF